MEEKKFIVFEASQFARVYSNWEATPVSFFCLFLTHKSSLLMVASPVP